MVTAKWSNTMSKRNRNLKSIQFKTFCSVFRIYDLAIDIYYNIPIQSTICTLRNVHKTPKQNENEATKDDCEVDEMIISQLCDCLFITQNKYYAKFYEVKVKS